jgi:medium-chain acyl-[acyl-carrier-protein] hydrolase
MSAPAGVWAEEFTLRAYEVDVCGRASAPTICNWLQETAGIHADRLGWSVRWLQEQGLTWVLHRLRLRLDRPVEWGERVRVETWPVGVERLFALRDFCLATTGGSQIGVATSSWIVLNVASRKPVRPPRALAELGTVVVGRALVDDMEPLPEPSGELREQPIEVRQADLDVNRHANNVSFVVWLVEALPPADLAHTLAELELEYRGEAIRGDRLLSQARLASEEPRTFLHRVLRAADARELARARTTWRP